MERETNQITRRKFLGRLVASAGLFAFGTVGFGKSTIDSARYLSKTPKEVKEGDKYYTGDIHKGERKVKGTGDYGDYAFQGIEDEWKRRGLTGWEEYLEFHRLNRCYGEKTALTYLKENVSSNESPIDLIKKWDQQFIESRDVWRSKRRKTITIEDRKKAYEEDGFGRWREYLEFRKIRNKYFNTSLGYIIAAGLGFIGLTNADMGMENTEGNTNERRYEELEEWQREKNQKNSE